MVYDTYNLWQITFRSGNYYRENTIMSSSGRRMLPTNPRILCSANHTYWLTNSRSQFRHRKTSVKPILVGYVSCINGHFRNLNWRYRFHICLAYFKGLSFREYPNKIWPEIWYSSSILGSWNSHWYQLPSGKRLQKTMEHHHLKKNGKSTISMSPFQNMRVHPHKILTEFLWFIYSYFQLFLWVNYFDITRGYILIDWVQSDDLPEPLKLTGPFLCTFRWRTE